MSAAVVILAAGTGSRVGAEVNKVLLPLGDRPVLAWSVSAALAARRRPPGAAGRPSRGAGRRGRRGDAAPRGRRGAGSSRVARPGTPRSGRRSGRWHRRSSPARSTWWRSTTGRARWPGPTCSPARSTAAREHGGALPVVPLRQVVRTDGGPVAGDLVAVQTPQAFRADALLAAYRAADADGFEGTDTASCLERYGDLRIAAVPSTSGNLKITFPDDVGLAARLR